MWYSYPIKNASRRAVRPTILLTFCLVWARKAYSLLDAVIATDEYIEDMQNKIEDLEEIEAEVIEELEDDEDYEGSGNEYPNSIYNM